MKLSGNTILITGGASGIGRGLAEALHQRKNQVIIAGRRKDRLMEVATANPGMAWIELNIEDPASISAVATKLTAEYPKLNVLINNAGIMNVDDVSSAIDEKLLVSTLTTSLMGPIRMTRQGDSTEGKLDRTSQTGRLTRQGMALPHKANKSSSGALPQPVLDG